MSTPPLTPANDAAFVLIAGLDIVGDVRVPVDVEVQGRIEGTLRAPNVRVAASAVVAGTLVGEDVEIYGTIEDGVVLANRVTLRGGCNVDADLFYRELNIEEDALFEGKSRRHENPLQLAEQFETE